MERGKISILYFLWFNELQEKNGYFGPLEQGANESCFSLIICAGKLLPSLMVHLVGGMKNRKEEKLRGIGFPSVKERNILSLPFVWYGG